MDRFVEVGRISRLHGYKGEVIAQCVAGQDSALSCITDVQIGASAASAQHFTVLKASWMPKGWKLKLAEIKEETEAKALVGQPIFVERALLPALPQNEFYVSDLVDFSVGDVENREIIGKVLGVETMKLGPDRWWMEISGQTVGVPAIRRYIAEVDTRESVVWISHYQGLDVE